MIELKAELERMTAKDKEFDDDLEILHVQVQKYDIMSNKFDLLNDSWKKEVQDRIMEVEVKQAID